MPGANVPQVNGDKVMASLSPWCNGLELVQDPGFGSIACRLVSKKKKDRSGGRVNDMFYVRLATLEQVRMRLRPKRDQVSVVIGDGGRMEISFELHPLRAHQDESISSEDLLAWDGWENGCYE